MLTIRDDQMVQIGRSMEAEYHDNLVRFFRTNVPDLVARFDDQTLRLRIAGSIARARGYGITSGEGSIAFVTLSLASGPQFDDHPKIRDYMTQPDPDPDSKIEWLYRRVIDKIK